MAAKCVRYPVKRKYPAMGGEVSTPCTSQKKRQLNKKDYSSVRNGSAIVEVSRRVQFIWEVFFIY